MNTNIVSKLALGLAAVALLLAAVALYRSIARATDPSSDARIEQLIDARLAAARVATPLTPAAAATLDEARVKALIDNHAARVSGNFSERDFNARVERGIDAYVAKQRQAEQDRPKQLAKNVPPPSAEDHVYGNPKAALTLIEYSDFECPYCKRFHVTAKQLVDESKGGINWVYRHFPLEFHNPGAQKQAEAAECAAELGGNETFWRYTDAVYARTASGGKGFPTEKLIPLAVEFGLDAAKFQSCLDSGRYAKKIQQQATDAQRAGIRGTPGSILYNNQTRSVAASVTGAQPLERLREIAGVRGQ